MQPILVSYEAPFRSNLQKKHWSSGVHATHYISGTVRYEKEREIERSRGGRGRERDIDGEREMREMVRERER